LETRPQYSTSFLGDGPRVIRHNAVRLFFRELGKLLPDRLRNRFFQSARKPLLQPGGEMGREKSEPHSDLLLTGPAHCGFNDKLEFITGQRKLQLYGFARPQ